jgi:hypothetical protein
MTSPRLVGGAFRVSRFPPRRPNVSAVDDDIVAFTDAGFERGQNQADPPHAVRSPCELRGQIRDDSAAGDEDVI